MQSDQVKGHLDLLLLGVLRDGPRHGYAVISDLRDRTDGAFDLTEGTVYPALHRLQDGGLLASDWEDVAGRRRRRVPPDRQGRVALAAEQQRWRSFAAAVDAVLLAPPRGQRIRGPRSGRGSGVSGTGDADSSPVEDYLDRLLGAAPGPPRQVRALLAEADAHLRDATADGLARGLTQVRGGAAGGRPIRARAVSGHRRGPPPHRFPLPALARQVVASGLLLGAIGGIAVGRQRGVHRRRWERSAAPFIVDISPTTRLAPSDCARWLSQNPSAHSCYQAALSDWAFEVVGFRLASGCWAPWRWRRSF